MPVGYQNKNMNTNLPEITADQYLVLEFFPKSIETRRINSLYEPRIQYYFKSPAKNKNDAYRAAHQGSKKTIVMNVGDIKNRANPQEIFVGDAKELLGLVVGGRSLFRVLVFDNPAVEEIVEKIAVEEVEPNVAVILEDVVIEEVVEEIEETVEEIVVETDGSIHVLNVNVSISEMKKSISDFDNETITLLVEQEKSGKNRAGMIKLLEARL